MIQRAHVAEVFAGYPNAAGEIPFAPMRYPALQDGDINFAMHFGQPEWRKPGHFRFTFPK